MYFVITALLWAVSWMIIGGQCDGSVLSGADLYECWTVVWYSCSNIRMELLCHVSRLFLDVWLLLTYDLDNCLICVKRMALH